MRNARVVGLSPDGMSLVVATDGGEELAIAADDRLRAAVRGDRPRLGQLENEMETSLSPRDIQTRIRSGATLEDVARVAGLPMDRVERFAAPVLAERDHVAITAGAGSVRRRGETSGHRNLRLTVAERLTARGVDIDSIEWDAYRLDDGRWTVTADYATDDEAGEHAEFLYDPRGRFSIAGNDQARALLGERPPGGPHSGDPADSEPTVDLSDELALVRATQEVDPPATDDATDGSNEPTIALVRTLRPVSDIPAPEPSRDEPKAEPAAEFDGGETAEDDGDAEDDQGRGPLEPEAEVESPLEVLYEMLEHGAVDEEYAGLETSATITELSVTEVTVTELHVTTVDHSTSEPTAADLDAADWTSLDPVRPRAAGGASDASAVPETAGGGSWEPAIIVSFPLEPSLVEDEPEPAEETAEPAPTAPVEDRTAQSETGQPETEQPETGGPERPEPVVDEADRSEEDREFELETEVEAPPVRKPARKKRASVPSWDEIMFGGPRPPSS